MTRDPKQEAWAKAMAMAKSGQYTSASQIEGLLRAEGFSHEVNAWRDQWEHDRLDQLCRDAQDK